MPAPNASRFPRGLNATQLPLKEPTIRPKGEPGTWRKLPVLLLTENTEKSWSSALTTAKSLPSGLNASDVGVAPVPNGEPGTGRSRAHYLVDPQHRNGVGVGIPDRKQAAIRVERQVVCDVVRDLIGGKASLHHRSECAGARLYSEDRHAVFNHQCK